MIKMEYQSGVHYGWIPKSIHNSKTTIPFTKRLRKQMNDPELIFISEHNNTMIIARYSIVDTCIKRLMNGEKMKWMPKVACARWRFIRFSLVHFRDGHSFHHASEEIRNNPDHMRYALSISPAAFRFAGSKLKSDLQFILSVIPKYLQVYDYIPRKYQKLPEVLIASYYYISNRKWRRVRSIY